jgi:hypothetical protein
MIDPQAAETTTSRAAESHPPHTDTFKFCFALVCVFALALGLRLTYFHWVRDGPLAMTDTRGYVKLAEALRTRGEYVSDYTAAGFPGDLIRPPGYPFFLLIANGFHEVNLVRTALIQSIMGGVWAAGLALLVGWLTTRWVGILAGFFYATEWVSIVHTPLVLSELLYSILQTLALLAFATYLKTGKTWQAVLTGVGLAAGALVRPQAWLLLIAFVIGCLLQPRRRWAGLVLLVTYTICVAPWALRNFVRHRVLTLSTEGSEVLELDAHSAMDHGPVDEAFYKSLERRIVLLSTEWEHLPLPPAERERAYEREAISILYHNARWALKQFMIGMVHTSLGTGRGTVTASLPNGPHAALRWYPFVMLQVVMLWGLAIVGVCYSKVMPKAAIGVLVVATFLIVLAPGIEGYGRYRVPAAPILCILAALGTSALWTRYRSAGQRTLLEVCGT